MSCAPILQGRSRLDFLYPYFGRFSQSSIVSQTTSQSRSTAGTTSVVTFQLWGRRSQSTAPRMARRLRVPPAKSLTGVVDEARKDDHIVFNPPPSTPSPYETPPAFLPPSDPRRSLLGQSYRHNNPWHDLSTSLPPLTRPVQEVKRYNLKPKDVEEIRRLRGSDPTHWTRSRLAAKFECSQFFIGLVAGASAEKKRRDAEKIEAIKASWGARRAKARKQREARRQTWERDE